MRQVIYLYIISIIILILSSCDNNADKLDVVYMLINENKIELAVNKFKEIPFASMKTDADKAYYRLIQVRLDYVQYIPIESEENINFSLNYYKKIGNKARIAECLFYKSAIIDEYLDNGKEAMVYLKQAETLLNDVDDIDLKHRVYEALANSNMIDEEYGIALNYALVNVEISEQANNKDWMAYSYILLSQIYRGLNDCKKEMEYYKLCMDNIKFLSNEHKVDFYNYLGSEFLSSDLDKASFYANKCIGTRNNAAGYMNLAIIAQRQKQYDKADSLFRKGLKGATLYYQAVILDLMMEMYIELGDYKKALEVRQEYEKVKEQRIEKHNKNGVRYVQMEYDYQLKELEARERMLYIVLCVVVFVMLIVIVFVYSKYRYNKIMRRVLEYQKLMDDYKARIAVMKDDADNARRAADNSAEHDRKIEELQIQIAELHNRQSEILRDGKLRYDEIIEHGSTAVRWCKNDFIHFIEYYRLIDMAFVHSLETGYDHLSPKYSFFCIIQHIGKSDEEIMRILGISESTLRSTRSRIKSKRFS